MIKETTQLQGFPKMKLPKLKGEVEIRLHNPTTGKTEIQRGENMITNAVYDIFASNYGGQLNYSELLPLYSKMFGGIFCFKDAFSNESIADATDYYVPDTSITTVTAHAGQTGYTTDYPQSDDLTRGYPQETQMSIADGQVTLAWEWGVSNGNGVIKALSLTHADAGDMGTIGTSNIFKATRPMIDARLLATDQSSTIPVANRIMFVDNDGYGYTFTVTADHTVAISKMPIAYKNVGLVASPVYTTSPEDTIVITKNVTVESTYGTTNGRRHPFYCYDKANNKLFLFHLLGNSSASNKIEIEELNLSNFNSISVTHREFNPTNVTVSDLYTITYANVLPFANGYVYLRTTASQSTGVRPCNGLLRLKVSPYTASDETFLSGEVVPYGGSTSPATTGRIVAGKYFIVNRNTLYPNNISLASDEVYGPYWNTINSIPTICEQQGLAALGSFRRSSVVNPYIGISKFYLGSKYNLTGSGVEKRPSQNMLIKYTLKEVEPEEPEE